MENKTITVNKIAYHEYFVEDTYQAGICLEGNEVKSVRLGNVNLRDSFCLIANREVILKNTHIAIYDKSGQFNTSYSKKDRKLLLNKGEILRIMAKVEQKGYTLVPLKMYFVGALVKVELGLCKGKHTFDKKRSTMQKDIGRKAEREIKEFYK